MESSRPLEKLMNQLGQPEFAQLWHQVRLLPEDKKGHLIRAFSAGQIESKLWLVDALNGVVPRQAYNICIVAGWVGVLVPLLWWRTPHLIRRLVLVDNDPVALEIAKVLHAELIAEKKLELIEADATKFEYDFNFNLIINTACEHFGDSQWFKNIPAGRLVVLQSTNADQPDHIRTVTSALQLHEQYPMKLSLYSGWRLVKLRKDKRYMRIGCK